MPIHSEAKLDEVHTAHRWEFDTRDGLLSHSDTDAKNIGKLAIVLEDNTIWRLVGVNPAVFVQHTYTQEDLELDKVDNTADLDKPISTANQNALDTKQDILNNTDIKSMYESNEDTNAFTDVEKQQVADNTTARHTHDNKAVLDKFGEDVEGDLVYNGNKVSQEGAGVTTIVINKPIVTAPESGATDFKGEIVTDSFNTVETFNGVQDYVMWEAGNEDFSVIFDSYSGSDNLTNWTPSIDLPLQEVFVRVKKGSDNHLSLWSNTIKFTTPDIYIETPTLTIEGEPDDVGETPTLTTSAFSVANGTDTHVSTDWKITRTSDNVVVWVNLEDTSNLLSIIVPKGVLKEDIEYRFEARHNGSNYDPSGWGEKVVTTIDDFGAEYGLIWDNINDTYTRTGKASSWTHGADFTNSPTIQSRMRRCVLKADGTVNYYLDPNDSTKKEDGTPAVLDGTDGNVMVEIPKFWAKYDNTNGAKFMGISTNQRDGYVLHPAFIKAGVEVDYRYYRAYKAYNNNGKLISRSGVNPTREQSINTFRNQARANGAGWELADWNLLFAVQTLLFVEIGTLNAQAILGTGNHIGDDLGMTTGGSNNIGNGSSFGQADDTWMSYRGIENFYADIREFIDGINISDRKVYTNNNHTTFESNKFDGDYVDTGITISTDGWIKDISFTIKGFIPIKTGGSDSTYATDYMKSSTGSRVVFFGGCAKDGLKAGATSVEAFYNSSEAWSPTGAGLSF